MNQKSFAYLAGACAALVVIILIATGGGLNGATRQLLAVEQNRFPAAMKKVSAETAELKATIAEEKALFRGNAATWTDTLETALKAMKEAEPKLAEAEKLAGEDDDEKAPSIEMALDVLRDARNGALGQIATVREGVNHLINLRKSRKQSVADAKSSHAQVKDFDLGTLKTRIERAVVDWPNKKTDLEKRLQRLSAHATRADTLFATVTAEDAKELDKIDFPKLSRATSDLSYLARDLVKSDRHVQDLIGQLYRSWDKILEDMSIDEGYDVRFRHKYKTTTVTVTNAAEKKSTSKVTSRWQNVSKAEFEKRKNQLGMSIAYKPAGKYDHEAVKDTPQPPGYSYIAKPGQRNQYGYWNNSGGNSFWVFYGQYSFMRNMFWGASYSPIYVNHYNDYNSYRSRGRSYYGRTTTGKQRYGTNGTFTKTRYSSSRYVKSSGFKNSKYVKTGGKYRGTRYSSRRTSSSSTRSRSRSSSSSRRSVFSSRSRSFGGGSRSFGGK